MTQARHEYQKYKDAACCSFMRRHRRLGTGTFVIGSSILTSVTTKPMFRYSVLTHVNTA